LAKIASLSVFHSWWNWHLNEDDTPEDMCELSALREDYPALDEDMHEHVKDFDAFKKKMKAKRDAEQNGSGDSGYASGAAAGWETENAITGAVGGWDVAEPIAASGDWNSGVVDTTGPAPIATDFGAVATEDNKENVVPGGSEGWDQADEGNDWADEVNDSAAPVASFSW
jgi:hypothetical protein